MTNSAVMKYDILWFFLKPHRSLFAGILVVALAASVLETLSLAAFFPVFSSLLDNTGEPAGGFLGWITGLGDLLPLSDPVKAAAALLIIVFLMKTLVGLIRDGLIAYAGGKILYDVKNGIMDQYAGAQYQYFLDNKQGSLIYNTLLAPAGVASVLLTVAHMTVDLLRIIAIFVLVILVSPLMATVLIVLGLGFFGVFYYISRKVSYNLGKTKARAYTEQTVVANEFFNGILQIMTFGTTRTWLERFRRENRIMSTIVAQESIWGAAPGRLMEFAAIGLMLGLILFLRSVSPDAFSGTLPKLGVFAVALLQVLPAINSFGGRRMSSMIVFPDVELAYFALTSPVPRRKEGTKVLHRVEQGISFEKVCFSHKDREALLKDVDLTFEKGKVTAIVGPSGAGKTTIVNLILGLFEPTGGRITVDGLPLYDYESGSWLSKIGFVSQEPFIHHSSIADNIIFSRDGHSQDSVIKAAKIANAHEFISQLPEGYETVVGDRGMKLSGGQQQRITIARAMLESPEILIFDEATSSLDTISERQVQEAIDNVSRDRTVILIAHRLSTVRYADKIIVLDDGEVIEEGSHRELLEHQGHYAQLVASSL